MCVYVCVCAVIVVIASSEMHDTRVPASKTRAIPIPWGRRRIFHSWKTEISLGKQTLSLVRSPFQAVEVSMPGMVLACLLPGAQQMTTTKREETGFD